MSTAIQSKSKSASAGGSGSKTLEDLFLHGIQDIYYVEKKLTNALPKIIKAASAPELVKALTKHLAETQEHVSTVEKVFSLLQKAPKSKKCAAMDGILEEADEILEEFGGTQTGDAAIIFSGQAVEHYEITRYGSLRAFAEVLGMTNAVSLLKGILDQEKAADQALSDLAEERIDYAASEAAGDNEDPNELTTALKK